MNEALLPTCIKAKIPVDKATNDVKTPITAAILIQVGIDCVSGGFMDSAQIAFSKY